MHQDSDAVDLNAEAEKFVHVEDARNFAIEVVTRLRDAGFEALWAGGCVRDSLLGLKPKDYDVATSAKPKQIRELFGRKRTLAIGASFGVMAVVGSKKQGTVEVATFRQDAEYSDGRHPDAVSFSNAEEDAKRRDFTINGLFYDPIDDKVIDYVGGQKDLKSNVLRAIGIAENRIAEDKLRMLRAVRFAAIYGFEIEEQTLKAIQKNAALISVVSRERIAAEFRRMMTHRNRSQAARLLVESKLLHPVFDSALLDLEKISESIRILELVSADRFATVFTTFLFHLLSNQPDEAGMAKRLANQLNEWKFTNEEFKLVWAILSSYQTLCQAHAGEWPKVQRVLVHEEVEEIMLFCKSLSKFNGGAFDESLRYCRGQLALPAEQLNPDPILNGDDLIKDGLRPGPRFKEVLERIRDLQLNQEISQFDEALGLAKKWLGEA